MAYINKLCEMWAKMNKKTDLQKYIEPAIQWALKKVGSLDFKLMCLAFVEDAYEKPNGIEMFGGSSAQESADMYNVYENISEPPKGAFVFYETSGEVEGEIKNWGHVGLCIGNDQIIHAWNKVRIDDYLSVQELEPAPSWKKLKFIGWAPIETLLSNYQINHEKYEKD